MKGIVLVYLILVTSILNGQECCRNNRGNYEKRLMLEDRVFPDRFSHTNYPVIPNLNGIQLESSLILRNEFVPASPLGVETVATHNAYTNHRLRFSFFRNLEFNISAYDILLLTGDEVHEYAGDSPYLRYAIGAKYLLLDSNHKIALSGLVAMPRQVEMPGNKLDQGFSPEVRLMYLAGLSQWFTGVLNIGGIMISPERKSLIYSLEFDWHISKGVSAIVELYKSYSHLCFLSNMNEFLLFGISFYKQRNLSWYLTYENDFFDSNYLKSGRLDLGFTLLF